MFVTSHQGNSPTGDWFPSTAKGNETGARRIAITAIVNKPDTLLTRGLIPRGNTWYSRNQRMRGLKSDGIKRRYYFRELCRGGREGGVSL